MIALIQTRLIDAAPGLTDVRVAEDLEAAVKGTASSSGTVYVTPYRELAQPNSLATGGHRQLVEVHFLVARLVRHHDDVKGAKRVAMFEADKAEIEAALAGWEPADGSNPCELVGGESSPLPNGVSLYVQTWETTRFLTGA